MCKIVSCIPGWVLNDRSCSECRHFFIEANGLYNKLGACRKKLMAVLKDTPVLSKIGETCFEELE